MGVFLLTEAHWDQATLGAVLTVSGMLGITLHTPIGAFIDSTHAKRGLIIAGVAMLAVSAVAIVLAPVWQVVLAADIGMAALGAIFGPTVAAITLGLVSPTGLAMRLGRNAAVDRAGNIFIAALAGFVGWWLSQRAVFYLVPLFACLSVAAVLSIPARAIDHERARGLGRLEDGRQPSAWRSLIGSRPLLVLAASAALFHFANAPMLPLLGQKLALAHRGEETVLLSASIMTAQFVIIPVAILVGATADAWGRKPILLLGLAALPIRGLLYTLSDDASWLIAVQILDGVGMGVYDTMVPLILADVMRGTGRYNVSRGIVGTVQGVGGSLSNVVAGLIVVYQGYNTAFLALAAVASTAFLFVLLAMPETMNLQGSGGGRGRLRHRRR